ncbi:MAG: MBOAT family protein [Oscillospiraceae bacterium]|jgi:alginate O-acetyltransferase complex protein AlgI|nr:MBOAT family protein [Oscillospiraceae bacterium]
MLFSSIAFLFYFLPVVFAVYFALPKKFRNIALLVASLFFYAYGEPKYVVLLVFSSLMDYVVGMAIDKNRGTKKAKYALVCSVVVNLLILGFFKYSDFFIANVNALFRVNIPLLHIPLPLGISFYTFQTMSYTIDVYRNDAKAQKNPFDFAAYVSLFPQLVAGPIVRYQTIAEQMTGRRHTLDDFAKGVTRFVIGLGKKVLLANTLGELNATALSSSNQSVLMYWLAIVAFMLQIYFDFSGYSDMAIGLSWVFGFHILENFNYPFIAGSITEFWQRWHISMGTWFREYIYIPLGGNRVKKWKWARNIAVVWFCTGLWHGAAWNFIAWGLYFGVLLALEKLFFMGLLKRIPKVFRHIYTLLAITVSFVIFHLESVPGIIGHLKGMFGFGAVPLLNAESRYYLGSYKVVLLLAAVGATPLLKSLLRRAQGNAKLKTAVSALRPVFVTALLLVVTAYLVDSSFNPFLYFRF